MPADAEALYETSCFASDNNAFEVRSLLRSGPTKIPQVQAARDALFERPYFIDMGIWDKNLFDGNPNTYFKVKTKVLVTDYFLPWLKGGALRVDFGEAITVDKLKLRKASDDFNPEKAEISADLGTFPVAYSDLACF